MRAVLAVAAAALLAACPGGRPEDSAQNAPPKTSTTVQNPKAVPENTPRLDPLAASTAVPAASTPR